MSDRLSRLEARLGGIDQALADITRRIDALEGRSCARPRYFADGVVYVATGQKIGNVIVTMD